MRLLIVTQAIDNENPALGFFVEWVHALATSFESIEVICLYEGTYTLPDNVRVHSLGKEKGSVSTFIYALRFLRFTWMLRDQYDAALVHMNQEYLLLAGPLWKVLKKRAYLWRNHYAGTILTDIAAAFTVHTFCTSQHSYTAKYKKNILMPVGIDLARYTPDERVVREPRSVLFLARFAPSKRPDLFVEALALLLKQGVSFVASIYGSPLPEDERYYESVKQQVEESGLHGRVRFYPGIPPKDTPNVFRAHQIFVNCSRSGMYDKTIFESAACGAIPIAASEDYALVAPELSFNGTPEDLAARLSEVLESEGSYRPEALAQSQSLDTLVTALSGVLQHE